MTRTSAIAYGPFPDQVADVWLPTGQRSDLLLVLIHGGDWQHAATREYLGPMAEALARKGHAVVSIEYRRLGGGGGWPATFDDVKLALTEVPRQVDARALGSIVVGHSAGGHLALWAAAQPLEVDPPLLGVLALGPTADLALGHELGVGSGAVAELLGGTPADVPHILARADPARLAPRVPVVILHADADPIVPVALSRSYVAGAQGDVDYRERPGDDHFTFTTPGEADWAELLAAISDLAGRPLAGTRHGS